MTPVATQETFAGLRADLADAIETGDDFRAEAIVRGLAEQATDAVSERDVRAIVELRAQVGRLARRMARVADGELSAVTIARLDTLDGVLDRGETAARMRRAAEQRDREAGVLADEIVVLLREGPRRPRELAERFGCDPSQVSRALRALVADGRAARVDPPAGNTDRRAHWFGVPA